MCELVIEHTVQFLECGSWEEDEDCFEKAGESRFFFLWENI